MFTTSRRSHMQQLATAFDEEFPAWRSLIGVSGREGVPAGWLASTTVPAGAMLAALGGHEQVSDAVSLPLQVRERYLIVRTPEAPELWLRAIPHGPDPGHRASSNGHDCAHDTRAR